MLGALLTLVVGAGLFTALYTEKSADNRSQAEFLRNERIEAYAQYLAAAEEAYDALRYFLPDSVETGTDVLSTITPPPTEMARIDELRDAEQEALGRVRLLAHDWSDETGAGPSRSADAVSQAILSGIRWFDFVAECRSDPARDEDCDGADVATSPAPGSSADGASESRVAFLSYDAARGRFTAAARDELEVTASD
ncbi:hypothetical protein SAMN05660690_1162 [Geodermatophilus telluris]|uniref:Uncharacterized protein n=2 Tax=Geodermatophilus telluris TaxID=1190417 RepID=A0A1G6L203_9ACTN|nr:hypothetical protein SAMN05660690_1162 [Geodermatophilus telluris]